MKSVAPSVPPSPPPSAPPPPPPPPAPQPAETQSVFNRATAYFKSLPRIGQVGWTCLLIGIVFTAAYEPAFWGVVLALILGIILLFQKPAKNGVILGGAALLAIVLMISLSVGHDAIMPKVRPLTANQQLVKSLSFSFRESLLDNTKVLRIYNPSSQNVEFHVRCHARNGDSSTLFVSAPAHETTEIGRLEGWRFEPGETFEAICDGDVIRTVAVP